MSRETQTPSQTLAMNKHITALLFHATLWQIFELRKLGLPSPIQILFFYCVVGNLINLIRECLLTKNFRHAQRILAAKGIFTVNLLKKENPWQKSSKKWFLLTLWIELNWTFISNNKKIYIVDYMQILSLILVIKYVLS